MTRYRVTTKAEAEDALRRLAEDMESCRSWVPSYVCDYRAEMARIRALLPTLPN